LATNQISRQHRETIVLMLRPAIFDHDVLALDVTGLIQSFPERSYQMWSLRKGPDAEKSDHRHRRLLRARRDRPRCRRAAERG